MGRSPGFGSAPCNYRPFETRFPYGFACRLNLAAEDNSLTHYAKGTWSPSRAPTARRRTVSGTISLPSSGFFSPFPRGTCSLSVASTYLALEDGPPRFLRGYSCPRVLRNVTRKALAFRVRGCHPLCRTFPGTSATPLLSDFPARMLPRPSRPTTPLQQRQHACTGAVWARPLSLAATRGVSVDFFSYGY